MKTVTHENSFINASWKVSESNTDNKDNDGKITMFLKPEFHSLLREHKRKIEEAYNGGKACKGVSDRKFWDWSFYGAANRVESEIIEVIEKEFLEYSEDTPWMEIITSKHEVNGYNIRYNESWKEFQTYHSEIGSTEDFQSYAEAVEYCKKG